jgi:hypothetical protein
VTVRLAEDGTITLEGTCPAQDAEALIRLLLLDPSAAVDWRGCDHAHTAIVRILLAARPSMRGPARQLFLTEWVEPMLANFH